MFSHVARPRICSACVSGVPAIGPSSPSRSDIRDAAPAFGRGFHAITTVPSGLSVVSSASSRLARSRRALGGAALPDCSTNQANSSDVSSISSTKLDLLFRAKNYGTRSPAQGYAPTTDEYPRLLSLQLQSPQWRRCSGRPLSRVLNSLTRPL